MSKLAVGTQIKVNADYAYNWAGGELGKISADDVLYRGDDSTYTVRLDNGKGPDFSGRDFWYMSDDEFTVVEEKAVAELKVGDKVRVVVDDPDSRTGQYVGKVGVIRESYARPKGTVITPGSSVPVSFGTGKAKHGDPDNGYWYCNEVEAVLFEVGDEVSWNGVNGYKVVGVSGDFAWLQQGDESDWRYTARAERLSPAVKPTFEDGKTYIPNWNDDARFTVADIWDKEGTDGESEAVGWYRYSADDIPFVQSYPNTAEAFDGWKEA